MATSAEIIGSFCQRRSLSLPWGELGESYSTSSSTQQHQQHREPKATIPRGQPAEAGEETPGRTFLGNKDRVYYMSQKNIENFIAKFSKSFIKAQSHGVKWALGCLEKST